MYLYEADIPKGVRVTSGSVVLEKNKTLIGISIGGGSPLCPNLYIVQVFEDSIVAKNGTLEAGDEIVAINGISLKGFTRVETAKLIQESKGALTINFNKLHIEPAQGNTLEINMKKMKHKLVENINTNVADAVGLSRAFLTNDVMVERFSDLRKVAARLKEMILLLSNFIHANFEMASIYKAFGDVMVEIGIRETQFSANEAFCNFGKVHQMMEKNAMTSLKFLKDITNHLKLFVLKALPDMKSTINKYFESKFEYLAYCLKIKEMDDEEYGYVMLQEPLYRLELGNYYYRLVLRHREMARKKFSDSRSDVLIKLDLLENKYVQDITSQLRVLIKCLSTYYSENVLLLKNIRYFPVEIDIATTTFSHVLDTEWQLEVDLLSEDFLPEKISTADIRKVVDARGEHEEGIAEENIEPIVYY